MAMSAPVTFQRLQFTGEVVGTFEQEGLRSTRVSLAPCQVTITSGLPPDLHLGDRVTLQVRMVIERVSSAVSTPEPKKFR